ncbi:hypothetical protein AB0368_37520 [Actinoplanes sp. NPDC051475]|uniref:hypothetical protein n=1 Tax=Actinoplanes sp. NPDC051475 TaxID=3157225 RepID=UPI00344EC681
MRAVIFGYFGTLTGPGAEEYREPLAHRTGELLGVCRPRFWERVKRSNVMLQRRMVYRSGTIWGPHVMRADALTAPRITSARDSHRA